MVWWHCHPTKILLFLIKFLIFLFCVKNLAIPTAKCYNILMLNLLIYFIFTLVVFAILFAGIKLFGKDAIFTIAIGTAIASNIYNPPAYPIQIGSLIFGLDAIVYTIFAFCILLMHIDHGKKNMAILLYTTLFSLFLAGFIAFAGTYFTSGLSQGNILNALSYVNCIIATFLAIWAMVLIFDLLRRKKWNIYISIFIALLVATLINSFFYFGLNFLISGNLGETFLLSLAGSYIGKIFAILLCVGIFFLLNRWVKTYKNDTNDKN